MAHQQDGAGVGQQPLFQELEGLGVEVVGGFVEHQDVRRDAEQPGKQQAVAFAAREQTYGGLDLVAGEEEVLEIAHDVARFAAHDHGIAAVGHAVSDGAARHRAGARSWSK